MNFKAWCISCVFALCMGIDAKALASDRIDCFLAPQLAVRFEGHRMGWERLSLGKYEIVHRGRIRDHFAYSFSFSVIDANAKVIGPTHLIDFHDDEPDCRNLVGDHERIFYLAQVTVYRFKDAEGQRGGEQLVMSEDGGKTFSPNLYPAAMNSLHDTKEVTEHRMATKNFGYHRGRINFDGRRLQLELANPLDYQQFLYFESTDFGRHWQRALPSGVSRVYPAEEVEKWREMFARNRWQDLRFKAEQQACRNAIEQPCALKTEKAWDSAINSCLEKANWQVCEKEFVAPVIEK